MNAIEVELRGGTVIVRESVKEISYFNFLYIHGYFSILTLSLEISLTLVSNLTWSHFFFLFLNFLN